MTRFRNLPAAQIGQLGEKLAAKALRQLGAGVIASFKFTGENDNEAPALEFHDERVVLPDMDVSMRPDARKSISVDVPGRFWLELKTYKEPQWNRAYRCRVHGVPARLVEQYEQNEIETGTEVYLGILEVDSGALLVSEQPISKIDPRHPCLCGCEMDPAKCEYRAKWGSSYPQWYFRRDTFREWYRLEGAELQRLQREHARVSHAIRRHGSVRETPSKGALAPEPWTWTCLPCDATGTGDPTKHRCAAAAEWRRDFWVQRFRWAMPAATRDELAKLVATPIARTRMVEILGPQWSPERDAR